MNLLGKKQLTSLVVILCLSLVGFLTLNYEQQVEAGNPLLKRKSEFHQVDEEMVRKQLEEFLEWTQPQDVDGTPKDDVIRTGAGDDNIQSHGGDDLIYAGPGNDKIRSGSDNDVVYAGAGDDYVIAGSGDDFVYAGWGDDYVSGGDGHDIIYGEFGNDELYGDDGSDSLYGGAGNDIIKGEDGNDIINGGSGRDDLYSLGGNDYMYGGFDEDHFVIQPSSAVEYNVIIDFTPAVDRIDLSDAAINLVDFADLLNHCSQTPQGVRISLPTNNSTNDRLLLINVLIADLDPFDFDI